MHRLVHHGQHRFRRHVRDLWQSRGGGFYGFVGALTFVYLETLDLAGDIAGMRHASVSLGWLIGFLVQNLVDALWFVIAAAIWPVEWINRFGVSLTSGALLLAAYGGYRLIRPTVLRWLEVPENDEELAPARLPE